MRIFLGSRSSRRRWSGRGRAIATAVAVVSVTVLIAFVAQSAHRPSRAAHLEGPVVSDGISVRATGKLPFPYKPVLAGTGSSVLVTGSVVGSDGSFSNPSFVFDIASGSLSEVAAPPFSPGLSGVHAVDIPGGVVIVGTRCASAETDGGDFSRPQCQPGDLAAAKFDFESKKWTVLKPPAGLGFKSGDDGETGIAVGWSGREAVFQVGYPGTIIAYNPGASSWSELPLPLPSSAVSPSLCASDSGIYAKYLVPPDTAPDPKLWKAFAKGVNVFRWQEGDWTELPSPSLQAHDPLSDGIANDFQVLCGRTGILLYTSALNSVWSWSSESQRWHEATKAPFDRTITGPEGQLQVVNLPNARWIEDEFVFSGAESPSRSGLAYSPTTDSWRETVVGGLGATTQDAAAVASGQVIAVVATAPGQLGIGTWKPAPYDGADESFAGLTTETTLGR